MARHLETVSERDNATCFCRDCLCLAAILSRYWRHAASSWLRQALLMRTWQSINEPTTGRMKTVPRLTLPPPPLPTPAFHATLDFHSDVEGEAEDGISGPQRLLGFHGKGVRVHAPWEALLCMFLSCHLLFSGIIRAM